MKTKPIPVLPLPIHTNDGDLFDSCDCRIARLSVLGEKYADFIVRACNSHEMLLEACKEVEDEMRYDHQHDLLDEVHDVLYHRVEAAIAQAENQ